MRHCHLRYDDDGYDIEGTAYQSKKNGSWDVFFDDIYDDLRDIYPLFDDEDSKVLIFSYDNHDLDYTALQNRFTLWVQNTLFNRAKNKDKYKSKYT